MVQTQDIFLRALAVVPDKKKRKGTYRHTAPAADDSKWSKVALLFDTESRITADQSLTLPTIRQPLAQPASLTRGCPLRKMKHRNDTSSSDWPNHLALPHRRETRRWWNGCRLQ